MRFEDQRKIMTEKALIGRDIRDERIINAFLKVPRELFVPEILRQYSYLDKPLSIGYNQTVSQPYVVAKMLQELELKEDDSVLEIGTGSGYEAALLAEIVKEVCTVERIEDLARRAKKLLRSMGYENINFKTGDGTKGWEKGVPSRKSFNKIVVSAGAPETIPPKLKEQLSEDGILLIPSGTLEDQNIIRIRKEKGNFKTENLGSCAFVPLIGEFGWDNGN
ncbi:MAG: protein-L-isoaspartate O-methyltransferase [Candidatus Cloacimonadota bacterium]|nr:MAG: protein-L-isoaspartate O-methyltransferase [Candidatus Cloacimonadota bacterium]